MTDLPGINIQYPWARLILEGKKTVKTRSYPIPIKYVNQPLAVIETPGKHGLRDVGISESNVIGIVVFSDSFNYTSKSMWEKDYKRHCVSLEDPLYGWKREKTKFDWTVEKAILLQDPVRAPKKRGIIFASSCKVPDQETFLI